MQSSEKFLESLLYGFVKDKCLARDWQFGGARLRQVDGIFLHSLVAGGEVGAGEEEHPLVRSENFFRLLTETIISSCLDLACQKVQRAHARL